MPTPNFWRRTVTTGATAAGAVLLASVPATAHVDVSSPDAASGDYGKLVFRVPNESESAATTKLRVELPRRTPFSSVSTKPVPGWSVEATTSKLPKPVTVDGATITRAVTSVTWTAEPGSALPPGQFQEFELSVGTFPNGVETLAFPATQTYSDGEVVAWSQPTTKGEPEPEHPAPVLELPTAADTQQVAETSSAVAPGSGDGVARALGGIACVLAAAALLRSIVARRRSRA
jgi:periplasmic copper chaperone A